MSGRTIYLRKLEKEGMEKRKGCNIPRGTSGRGYKREGKGLYTQGGQRERVWRRGKGLYTQGGQWERV